MADARPGTERLVTLTDGVVAIAITLLVLPLVDQFIAPPRGQSGTGAELWQQIVRHRDEFLAYALSFALIARQWWWHHQVFGRLKHLSTPIVLLDLVWVFTIVTLPLPTVILAAWDTSPLSFGLYSGTLLVSAISLSTVVLIEYRAVAGTGDGHRRARRNVIASLTTVVCFAAVLAVGLLVTPGWGYACYSLLVLTGPVEAVLDCRRSEPAGVPE